MEFLLDTSVCVSLIRGHSAPGALPAAGACGVSVITAAELEVGIRRSQAPGVQRRAVETLLGAFVICPLDLGAVAHYGEIRTELERRGTPIGPLDLLIAAHARSLGATLVTANVGEFRRVPGLKWRRWN